MRFDKAAGRARNDGKGARVGLVRADEAAFKDQQRLGGVGWACGFRLVGTASAPSDGLLIFVFWCFSKAFWNSLQF